MAYEYLLTALPALPENFGDKSHLDPSALYSMIKSEGDAAYLLGEALLYSFDVKAMEKNRIGTETAEGAVHTSNDIREKSSLPHWFKTSIDLMTHDISGCKSDILWSAYYGNLKALSETFDCQFLRSWIPWEISMKKAVAMYRSSILPLHFDVLSIDAGGFVYSAEFKPIIESLISLRARGADAWRDMDAVVANAKIDKARELAPSYEFDLNELMSYVVQYIAFKEFEYL